MGSCISMQKNPDSAALRVTGPASFDFEIFNMKTTDLVHHLKAEPAGSKEEVFFDSQPWLESDSEDYFSINGDNTPSFGASPAHQLLIHGDKKKKLFELFGESFNGVQIDGGTSFAAAEQPAETPLTIFGDNSQSTTGSGEAEPQRRKSVDRPVHCLPGLFRSLSCGDCNRKNAPSPVHIDQGWDDRSFN
ncbi:hypothetical protein Nepgr_027920 [Nepenthes gracilis]|uniref:Uncharacterized protein n=1 Tax=Nepenthes gracilis TaxID=150966 RepID=A0AAD3TB02_NEPGR|nr:hypothetical protein Nepgr_027920 [Nepenthes gracilis]